METPLVTGTFMEYRTGHFHGGVDLISGVSNHIVRPVANGTLVYRYQYAEVGQDTVYRFWIDHPADGDTTYAGLATRYLHIGGYPGKELHGPGIPRTVTTKDTLGTIITPDDGFDDHVHFEVRDGNNRRDADYINPLRKLPAITDATVNYATGRNPWTWTVESETRTEEYDVSASEAETVSLPKTDLRFLFEGFDRINRPASRLGFYSMRANFIKSRTVDGEALTDTLLKYSFTADRLPHGLWLRPEYLFDTHRSSASEFHYRLFVHENANNLSITMTDGQGAAANPDSVDDDGYIDGAAYDLSSGHSIQVVVGDYAGDTLSRKLVLSATAIGDRFSDLRAKGIHRQVTLRWYSFRAGGWTEFEIQRSRDSGVSYTAIGTLAYDPASEDGEYEYVDGTATDAVTYYYRIFTDELYGPVWASSTGADPTPVPTGTPAISLGNTGAGYYGLQIDTGSDYANGYQVVYGPVDQAFPWSANLSGTNETTVYDELLGTGAYKVRVRAYNSAGDGPYSNEVRFTLAPPSKPATPTGTVEAVRAGSDRGWALMRWTANSEPDIVGYRIYWAHPGLLWVAPTCCGRG